MTHDWRRERAVADPVHLRGDLAASIAELRAYPRDCNEDLVGLGPPDLRRVLEAFLAGEVSADDPERWVNAVEAREDIGFRPQEIIDLMTELANLLLFDQLTCDSVSKVLMRLPWLERP